MTATYPGRRDVLKAGLGAAALASLSQLAAAHAAAARAEQADEVDYVVIGSGPGGGPLAARLAEDGHDVLVLEAGPPEGNDTYYKVPGLHLRAARDPEISWDYWVRHYSDRSEEGDLYVPDKDGILYPRAATLGGCTAHHALVTMYPENEDWDHLKELTGDASWGRDAMWKRWERMHEQWQPTELASPMLVLKDDKILRALLGTVGEAGAETVLSHAKTLLLGRLTADMNDRAHVNRSTTGLFLAPQATKGGKRVCVRERLLSAAAKHKNLAIATNALAERVVLERAGEGRRRAVAVEYLAAGHAYAADPEQRHLTRRERKQARRSVRVRKEVIVAGGAFNSPQLLMLSGIGPRRHLERHGIPVEVDLPGVGGNLQDRYECAVVSRTDSPFSILKDADFQDKDDAALQDWRETPPALRTGSIYGTNGVVAGVRRRSKAAKRPGNDLFVFGFPVNFTGYAPRFDDIALRDKTHFSWLILKGYADSRAGTVRLRSDDPTDTPAVNFRKFDDGKGGDRDVAAVIEGIEAARRINRLSGIGEEVKPGPKANSRAELERYVRRECWGHHASCTNPIGPERDKGSVLDSRMRVHGTANVRVVDASAFPRIPGLFLWLPTALLSEKAADDIRKERR